MKYIESRPSGVDKDIEIPLFSLNKSELKIIYAVLKKAKDYLPSLLTPEMGRINNILRTIEKYLEDDNIHKLPRNIGSGM